MFCQEDGSRLDPRSFSRAFKRLLEKAGLPDFRVHDMRHTFATLLLQEEPNYKIDQEALGHASSQQTLDTYSHVTSTMMEQAIDKLNGVFAALTQ